MFQRNRSWLSFLLLSAATWTSGVRGDDKTFYRNQKYNEGDFGKYPVHHFQTSDLTPPRINFMQPFTDCDDGSYIFVAPRGNVPDSSFYILDHEGSLVWGPDHSYGEVYNFQVQDYQGDRYLVFWAGDDSIGGHGEGKYFMLDQHYEEHAKISAGDGIRGDLHSFDITTDETAVYSAYEIVQADLSSVGRRGDTWIWESLFQELDIESGEVIFQWRASEHVDFSDVYVTPGEAKKSDPWDFFHINMVEKDKKGNYLVSSRYLRGGLYISGKTGEILWQLGGKKNSFKDLSNGDATTFLGQHDIHWDEWPKYITMFDNRGDWFTKIENQSRGHKIEVDLDKMTAKLVQSYVHPEHILSTSQGSMQVLPNGHVILGYGFNGVFTEFTADGKALCDAYMMPASEFGSGNVQSYRNMKFNWTGIPLSTPAIAFSGETLYMSWLGSTKVRQWLMQDSDAADGTFENVQVAKKKGFETEFDLKGGKRMREYVRVIAVDEGGTQLAVSAPVDLVNTSSIWSDDVDTEPGGTELGDDMHDHDTASSSSGDEDDYSDVQVLFVLGVFALVSAMLVGWMTFGSRFLPFKARGFNAVGGFKDDSKVRRFFDRVLSSVPGAKRSWQETASAKRELLDEREREEGGGGDMTVLSNADVSDEEEGGARGGYR